MESSLRDDGRRRQDPGLHRDDKLCEFNRWVRNIKETIGTRLLGVDDDGCRTWGAVVGSSIHRDRTPPG